MRFLLQKMKKNFSPPCHEKVNEGIGSLQKITIVGNPNVGKSLIFNRLTKANVSVSNYPGTTVVVTRGRCSINERDFGVIDTPGIYSMAPITEEERVAKLILLEEESQIVLHVVDAKNIERMLPLTLQLIEAGLPVILGVNMMDEARRLAIRIDFNELEEKLGVPVVPMVASTGEGMNELIEKIKNYRAFQKIKINYGEHIESALSKIGSFLRGKYPISKRSVSVLLLQEDEDAHRWVKEKDDENYEQIEKIVKASPTYTYPLSYIIRRRLQKETDRTLASCLTVSPGRKISFREKISRAMTKPVTGVPILIAVLYFCLYQFVGVLGAGVIVDFIEGTVFAETINPWITKLLINYIPYHPLQQLFIGEYGILTLGVTYAIAIIFPVVGTFFLMFSIIEDTGYLPRLALLIDRIFQKIGLTGRAVIPMVLGLGCDTMATMVTRTQETSRERVISTLLLGLAVPCSAQLGVIFAILSPYPRAILIWFLVIASNFIFIGFLASRVLPGDKPSFYMEVPPLRVPALSNVVVKTYTRMVWYFKEVFPLFILASIIIWIFQLMGLFQFIMNGLEPVVNLIGLPDETSKVFLFGFFRRDYGAAGLYEMQDILTGEQLTVAAVTLTLFVPCIAQFMVMMRERGIKTALFIFVFILFFAFSFGFILNQILNISGVKL